MPRSAPCEEQVVRHRQAGDRAWWCARAASPVNVVGLSSRQCSLPGSRPSAAICSSSNFFSSASTSSSTLVCAEDRKLLALGRCSVDRFPCESSVVGLRRARIDFVAVDRRLLDAQPHQARRPWPARPGSTFGRLRFDRRFEYAATFAFVSSIIASSAGSCCLRASSCCLLQLEQLQPLLLDAELQLVLLLAPRPRAAPRAASASGRRS